MKTLFAFICFAIISSPVLAQTGAVHDNEVAKGRIDFGWEGSGGGNLESYSKSSTGYPGRQGQFKFIFGGAPTMGKILFTHYNGSGWRDVIAIMPSGDLIAKGTMKSTQMIVGTESEIWPDYVFKESYSLMPIADLKQFIEKEGHLPGMPTAADIEENGHNLGLVSVKTLEKVEELALYVIHLKEENEDLRSELNALKTTLEK
ncbi:hypothetical protein [Allochromatium palmeri]|uniref:Peptidase S74 domain-containing protein n=1 Tax=Allochromatium palmeri TaxID=231048 RepID=A0A6N8EJ12_9GAMM|nr:hypothetical protein [Allochromatium palmeri]MTW22314.1 hypothetical protein [Allochromatium palmeri]